MEHISLLEFFKSFFLFIFLQCRTSEVKEIILQELQIHGGKFITADGGV